MTQTNGADATALADKFEQAVNNPEETARRIEKKVGVPGVFGVFLDFIKSYKAKEGGVSDEEWLARQFSKPEYAEAFAGENPADAAKGIVQGVEDYENAKKSLRSHIQNSGGSRETWLAQQINIGAEANNVAPAEYARQISEGLDEAIEENARLILDDKEAE